MFSKSFLAQATLALSLTGGADAFWRQVCGIVNTGRIDPIIAPGVVSSHVHKLAGGSNINTTATYASMRQSSCTSCEVQADKSGYWTPQLYYQHIDGTFEEVPNTGMTVYYLGRGDVPNIKPFPPGFQMLSGNMFARSYDNATMTWGNSTFPPRPVADRVSFVCLNDGNTIPDANHMAVTDCPYGLRAQIQLQSCWDGVNNYLPNNGHVDYLSQIDNGHCSPKFPVQLPHLFFEVLYAVADIKLDGGHYTFSYGDTTGYGFHGDFLMGWDTDVLAKSLAQCISITQDADGTIDECAPLTLVENYDMTSTCSQITNGGRIAPIINETVQGIVGKSLPGCNPIFNGPATPPFGYNDCPASVPTPTYNAATPQTPWMFFTPTPSAAAGLAGWAYANCYPDNISGVRTLNGPSMTSTTNMTIEVCQAYCAGQGYALAGVEYSSECYCGGAISSVALSAGAQKGCTMECSGKVTEYCGGPNYISIFQNVNATATSVPGSGPTSTAAGVYVGCAVDNTNGGRALNGSSTTSTSMTLEVCRSYCDNLGYMYSGTEYSTECYCGNYFTQSSGLFANGNALLSSNSTCAMLCAGNRNETCGGPNRLSVFNSTVYQPRLHVPSVGSYKYQGCWSEGASARALAATSFTNTTGMTAEMCISQCSSAGYSYAGMEYAQECHCGNALAAGATAPLTDCSMACVGNKFEFCGAGNRLDLYFNGAVASTAAVFSTSSASASSSIKASSSSSAQISTSGSSSKTSSSSSSSKTNSSSSSSSTSSAAAAAAIKKDSTSAAATTSAPTAGKVVATATSTSTGKVVATAHAKRHILAAKGAKGRKHGVL